MGDDGPRRIPGPPPTTPAWLLLAGLAFALAVVGALYGAELKSRLATVAMATFRPNDPSAAFKSHFADCLAAHQAGVYSVPRGAPQYRAELDADGDGLACEPDGG